MSTLGALAREISARVQGLGSKTWSNTPLRRAAVLAVHAGLWLGAFELALYMRFDRLVPPHYARIAAQTVVLLIALRLVAFLAWDLFSGVWRYAGFPELEKIVLATTASSAAAFLLEYGFTGGSPRSVYVGEWLASIVLTGVVRMALRSIVQRRQRRLVPAGTTRTLIVGAGDAGESFVRAVQSMRDGARCSVAGFLDDHPAKRGASIRGVKVLGAADDATIERQVRADRIELVVLAMPTAPGWRIREIVRACRAAGAQVKTVPALADLISSKDSWNDIREINID